MDSDADFAHAAGITLRARSTGNALQSGGQAERSRLEAERFECARNLEKINADLELLEANGKASDSDLEGALHRLHQLATLSPVLRTSLHALLGYAQLLRQDGSLTLAQKQVVDSILAAGTRLLGQVFSAVSLADVSAAPPRLEIEDTGFRPPAEPAEGGDAIVPPVMRAPSLRVLIADDNAANRDIAVAFLQAHGHAISWVCSGKDAVRAAANADFDVILLDVRMPELDGMEAARRIRLLPGPRGRTPIVALTALACQEEIEQCRAAGMNGHLAKPFRADTLNEVVRDAFALAPPSVDFAAVHQSAGQDRGRDRPAGRFGQAVTVPHSYRQLLADERTNLQGGVTKTAAPGWIDIASPWTAKVPDNGGRSLQDSASLAVGAVFSLKLIDVGEQHGRRRLVGATLCCSPPADGDQHEFHWLAFVGNAPSDAASFRVTCDLWRWSHACWQSIGAPGAAFSPEEMFEQGWRYCSPCVDPVVRVDVC